MPGTSVLPRPSVTCAPEGTGTDAAGPAAVTIPLSTTTVWSTRNLTASASKSLTLVNATGLDGTLTSSLASAGACAASAFACASWILDCSPAYASGNHARPKAMPKNLLLASDQIGSGELLIPVTAHSVIVCRAAPLPTSRSVNRDACALPPGSSGSVLSARASSDSISHAVVSIGPPCDT